MLVTEQVASLSRVIVGSIIISHVYRAYNYSGPLGVLGCIWLDTKIVFKKKIIIWFGNTVTILHLTKCNTNSKVRAMSA